MPHIFDHARDTVRIDDPGGFLRAGYSSGEFSQQCPIPGGTNGAGTVPMPHDRMSPLLVVLGGMATLLCVSAVLAGTADSALPAVVFTGLAVLTGGAAVLLLVFRRRDRAILRAARATGWLRYAPALVGAVWADRTVQHGPAVRRSPSDVEKDRRYQETRYWFRATVDAQPTDGTAPFLFTTAPFEALANQEGIPYGLNVADTAGAAPNPIDAWEPEYLNGWTIVRYRADIPEQSATVATGLSRGQVSALLSAAGIR